MYHGIINVYKEPGYTSHDVVARLRGILKQKKIGHTGTLDPAAEGVLPVCLGMGTRLCDMLADRTKTYDLLQRHLHTNLVRRYRKRTGHRGMYGASSQDKSGSFFSGGQSEAG